MSKQDVVVEMVKEGIHNRDAIRTAAECTSGALASYLSGMRNAAKYTGEAICPVTDENGIYSVTTFALAEEAKAEKAASRGPAASKKTPEERLEAAKTRVTRCNNALDKAVERAEANEDDRELQLRRDKARIEADLADIELDKATALVAEGGEATETTPEDTPEEADDFPVEEDELI